MGHNVKNQDELVAMNLAASICDVILLMGFDWGNPLTTTDKITEVKANNYLGLVHQAIKSTPNVQWILVDHPADIRQDLLTLPNLEQDTFENVLAILGN
jgi:basic membrane lipoprotein Med (substrate-binding protein (PBP1-ABC) superfamily)